MLILKRKFNESIIIDKNIKIKIMKVQGNQVSLGIDAPGNLFVYRDEIYEEIRKENINAVHKSIDAAALRRLKHKLPFFSFGPDHQKGKTISASGNSSDYLDASSNSF